MTGASILARIRLKILLEAAGRAEIEVTELVLCSRPLAGLALLRGIQTELWRCRDRKMCDRPFAGVPDLLGREVDEEAAAVAEHAVQRVSIGEAPGEAVPASHPLRKIHSRESLADNLDSEGASPFPRNCGVTLLGREKEKIRGVPIADEGRVRKVMLATRCRTALPELAQISGDRCFCSSPVLCFGKKIYEVLNNLAPGYASVKSRHRV